jgi:hypothetical protein
MKIGPRKYWRAMFLKERALELIRRHGIIEPIRNRGFGRSVSATGFSVWYTDPETSICDEYHHLDVYADGRGKVLNIRWIANQPADVVTFKRGPWEEYFLS